MTGLSIEQLNNLRGKLELDEPCYYHTRRYLVICPECQYVFCEKCDGENCTFC